MFSSSASRTHWIPLCIGLVFSLASVAWLLFPRPPKTLVNTLGMTLVRIEPGRFLMGSSESDQKWALEHDGNAAWIKNEGSPISVKLTQAYWIGATETTVRQYRQFHQETRYRSQAEQGKAPLIWNTAKQGWEKNDAHSWADPNHPQTGDHPVTCMSWFDAAAFCGWLTEREQKLGFISTNECYRLPTEAEWEYACRGNRKTRYAWGDDYESANGYANVVDSTPLPDGAVWKGHHLPWKDGYAFTAPVAAFQPTRNGLYDMHGNVWEWCWNYYYPYPNEPLTDPMGPTNGFKRVLRGGSWDNNIGSFRATLRRDSHPYFSADTTGFRIVLAAVR